MNELARPSHPPLPYANPSLQMRPVSVSLLAIVGVIIAVLLFAALSLGLMRSVENLIGGKIGSSVRLPVWGVISNAIGVGLALVLLIASMGALRLRAWAWRTMMVWSLISIVFAPTQWAVQIVLLIIEGSRQINEGSFNSTMFSPDPFDSIMIGTSYLVLVAGSVLPIAILIFWNRSVVRDAFGSPLFWQRLFGFCKLL